MVFDPEAGILLLEGWGGPRPGDPKRSSAGPQLLACNRDKRSADAPHRHPSKAYPQHLNIILLITKGVFQ